MTKQLFFIRRNSSKEGRQVLTNSGKWVNESKIRRVNDIKVFDEKQANIEVDNLRYQNNVERNSVWKVTFNTSNILLKDFFNFQDGNPVYDYINVREADYEHRDNIYAKMNRHANANLGDFMLLQNYNEKDYNAYNAYNEETKINKAQIQVLEMGFDEFMEEFREIFKFKLVSVEFIPKRKRTVLKFFNGIGYQLLTTNYSGEVGDKGYSNVLGFLFGVYKYKHDHLSSDALKNKIELVLRGLTKKQQEVYLLSFFVESGLFRPSKALKIIEAIRPYDKHEERIEINF